MLASVIFDKAKRQLQDDGLVRWPAAALLAYLNQGRREIVKRVPQEFRANRVLTLVAGAWQTVPADCAHFFGLTRNMGADGTTPGAVIYPADRSTLDAYAPNWMSASGTAIKEVMVADPKAKAYLVNPPVASVATVKVEAELAAFLADLTQENGGEDIGVSDRYETALVYWLCHSAHSEETKESSPAKAAAYYEAFIDQLGGEA